MTDEMTNFDDYEEQLLKKLRSLRHFERCVFTAWCVDDLLAMYAQPLEQNLSEPGLKALRKILDELWSALLTGSLPDKKTINRLDETFIEVEDKATRVSQDASATIVQRMMGLCILGCRRNDVSLAQEVGTATTRLIGYELRERKTIPSLETVFQQPAVQQKIAVQFARIKHLRGNYPLDGSLRSALRE